MPISERIKRLLWSRSGGYCQNPNCHSDFFKFFGNGTISSIEELAHIIPRSLSKGPRCNPLLQKTQLDEYENIILLCPNCHTLIDKNPEQYPEELLRKWKIQHENLIKGAFVVPIFDSRIRLHNEISKLLRRNRKLFDEYGPHSRHAFNPLSEAATVWKRYIVSDILPNNRQIANLLIVNEHLLTDDEKRILDKYLLHQEAFEYNHISGNKISIAPLFPNEMNHILED